MSRKTWFIGDNPRFKTDKSGLSINKPGLSINSPGLSIDKQGFSTYWPFGLPIHVYCRIETSSCQNTDEQSLEESIADIS